MNKGFSQESMKFGALVPEGLRASGLQVRIKGVLNQNRLVVNFSNNQDENDIPFHISIRPNENVIVRNDYVNNQWRTEERGGTNPIQFGSPFDMLISREECKYRIEINGNHFADFNHRCPAKETTYFSLYGDDCKIDFVSFNNIHKCGCAD